MTGADTPRTPTARQTARGRPGGICRLLIVVAFVLASPAHTQPISAPIPDVLTPQSIAQARAEMEARAAVAVVGTRVCRALPVGIGESDWIKGSVIAVHGSEVTVKIEAPGRFSLSLNGVMLGKGVDVRDAAVKWTPCL